MIKLNEKGLEASFRAANEFGLNFDPNDSGTRMVRAIIRAYLSHATPTDAEVAEMVKRLRVLVDRLYYDHERNEAAALIERLAFLKEEQKP